MLTAPNSSASPLHSLRARVFAPRDRACSLRLGGVVAGVARALKLWFIAVLFVVRFGRLFRVNSSVNCVRPRQMGVVSRFLVLSSFVVLRCFTMMTSSVGMMFLCFLVVFASFLRHFAFAPYTLKLFPRQHLIYIVLVTTRFTCQRVPVSSIVLVREGRHNAK